MSKLLLSSILFILFQLAQTQTDVFKTIPVGDLGNITGIELLTTTFTNRTFLSFHGIPYAHPTNGTGRFKPSVLRKGPLTDNGNPFLALNPLIACPQGGIFGTKKFSTSDSDPENTNLRKILEAGIWKKFNSNPTSKKNAKAPIEGSIEDEASCLVINVNTPWIPETEEDKKNLLPVIFFIHGGSSTSVFGAPFNGFRLMSRDVVLVSINYRLGVLGAFNLGTDDAPGNAAMYDSITALRWVQDYIEYFGGDKNRVAIYGHSAGSMMVSHLFLSPMGKGLFSGVIGASGSALACWGTASHPSEQEHLRIAEYVGAYTPGEPVNKTAIIEKMQAVPVDDLLDALDKYTDEEQKKGLLGFDTKVPSIQSPDLTIEKFLVEQPIDILTTGRQNNVSLIMGATRHDGSFAFEDIYDSYLKDKINDEEYVATKLVPELFKTMKLDDRSSVFYQTTGLNYMGSKAYYSKNFWEKLPGLIDVTSVYGFKAGSFTMVQLHSKINKHSYYYSLDHKGLWTTYDLGGTSVIPGGIAHVDDMMYPFQIFPLLTQADIGVANRMIDYFVNFASSGNPNEPKKMELDFPAYDPMTHAYLSINKTDSVRHDCRDSWAWNSLEIAGPDKLPTYATGVKYPAL